MLTAIHKNNKKSRNYQENTIKINTQETWSFSGKTRTTNYKLLGPRDKTRGQKHGNTVSYAFGGFHILGGGDHSHINLT